ncbi:MAG: Flp pilus assembly complex ATPase component TadA [Deltaproteobacteria bacterium]|nr:Flp pilus assembly complex ATPase component TadA [Deltaproteobacteria bacterium]MBZ0219632.1 Flp pilus assembly complex ATPase component TadA [Deltaproteobacteria bacterium]
MAVKKIGELLVESGLITEEQLEEALAAGKENKGTRTGALLVKLGYATEIDIAQTLSYQVGIPFMDMASTTVDPESLKLVSEKLARKYLLVPLYHDKKVLRIAMADPLNLNAIDDLRFSTGMEIQPFIATLSDINAAISRYYHLNEPMMDEILGDFKKDRYVEIFHESESSRDLSEQVKKSAAPPIIKMVDSILIHGFDNRASDIHIEPQEKGVKLRIRVDGLMRETKQLPKWVQGPVVSRIKIMARMDIAERRTAQDGRFKVRIGEKSMDVRVSSLPTQYGETIVMRLLDPKAAMIDIEGIGIGKKELERVLDIIERPQGVVLVTGPTGSGKTSTLYAMLARIKKEEINIITIEDPIEYELKDVNQVAVNDKTGLTFSYTLRSVLRQDPDVILVGEMRDAETATIAHQASLTGHLVFSTLHTNDAVSSITRLRNLGVPSYMAASALNGIVAQRLVRVICKGCREEYTPTGQEIRKAGLKWSGKKLYRGAGCNLCADTGYSGRTGIFEIISVNSTIKNLIAAEAPEREVVAAALEEGMTPMHMDGLKKVASGITTLEELARVIYMGKEAVCPACLKTVPAGTDKCLECESDEKAALCPS